jgi:hypothetical protein
MAVAVLTGPITAPWTDSLGFLQKYVFELCLIAVFLVTHRYDRHALVRLAIARAPGSLVWVAIALAATVAITVSQGSSSKFIYFDF